MSCFLEFGFAERSNRVMGTLYLARQGHIRETPLRQVMERADERISFDHGPGLCRSESLTATRLGMRWGGQLDTRIAAASISPPKIREVDP